MQERQARGQSTGPSTVRKVSDTEVPNEPDTHTPRLASCAPPGLFQQLLVLPLDGQVNQGPARSQERVRAAAAPALAWASGARVSSTVTQAVGTLGLVGCAPSCPGLRLQAAESPE